MSQDATTEIIDEAGQVVMQSVTIKTLDLTHATPVLFAAMAAAQATIENAEKNATNLHLKNKYADLSEVLNSIRAVFPANNLVLFQSPSFDGEYVDVVTVVAHSSGAYLTTVLSGLPPMAHIQGVGAAITYLRRYAAAAIACIAPEDTDAETLTGIEGDRHQRRDSQPRQEQQRMPQAKQGRAAQQAVQQAQEEAQDAQLPDGPLFGEGISIGQEGLIRAKGTAAGFLTDHAIYQWFGTVTPQNINEFMSKARDAAAQQ